MRLSSRPASKPALVLAVLTGLASSHAWAQGPDAPPSGLDMSALPEPLMAMVRDLNAPQTPLPAQPTAVALPTLSAKITGPGAMYESAPAQWPGRDMKFYKYVANEYFVSGTAGGKPYTTRVVVRQPADNAKFSGIVVAESMHPIGGAHAFEYNSVYLMDAGHVTVEIATVNAALFAGFNAQRYKGRQDSTRPDQPRSSPRSVRWCAARRGRWPACKCGKYCSGAHQQRRACS